MKDTRQISALYEAFTKVPRPKYIEACPCCMDESDVCTLLTKNLTEIEAGEISAYASKVFLTVGAAEDFHYFIPRILELLVTVDGWWPDPEVVGRAIGAFGWQNFDQDQQVMMRRYFDGVISNHINEGNPDGGGIDSWLCCTSHFLPGWERYLGMLEQKNSALTALYEWHAPSLSKKGDLTNGFWDDSPRRDEFKLWLERLIANGSVNSAYGL